MERKGDGCTLAPYSFNIILADAENLAQNSIIIFKFRDSIDGASDINALDLRWKTLGHINTENCTDVRKKKPKLSYKLLMLKKSMQILCVVMDRGVG